MTHGLGCLVCPNLKNPGFCLSRGCGEILLFGVARLGSELQLGEAILMQILDMKSNQEEFAAQEISMEISWKYHGNIMEISCYIPIVFMIFHARQDEKMS